MALKYTTISTERVCARAREIRQNLAGRCKTIKIKSGAARVLIYAILEDDYVPLGDVIASRHPKVGF